MNDTFGVTTGSGGSLYRERTTEPVRTSSEPVRNHHTCVVIEEAPKSQSALPGRDLVLDVSEDRRDEFGSVGRGNEPGTANPSTISLGRDRKPRGNRRCRFATGREVASDAALLTDSKPVCPLDDSRVVPSVSGPAWAQTRLGGVASKAPRLSLAAPPAAVRRSRHETAPPTRLCAPDGHRRAPGLAMPLIASQGPSRVWVSKCRMYTNVPGMVLGRWPRRASVGAASSAGSAIFLGRA